MIADEIKSQMMAELAEEKRKEHLFFARHGHADYVTQNAGEAHAAHKAWVKVCEKEFNKVERDYRIMCNSPIARKMFIIGWLIGTKTKDPPR